MLLAEENPNTRGNICPGATLSTTNPSQIGLTLLGHHRVLPNTFKATTLQIRYHIVSGLPMQ